MTGAAQRLPGLTVCSLCVGETLGADDPVPGGQLARLRAMQEASEVRLTLVECLDECERGDVVVVRPCTAARGRGRPAWFAGLAGDDVTGALREWVRSGGPGVSALPPELAALLLDRDGRQPG